MPTARDIVRLVESYRAARVLTTACGLGVFDALGGRAREPRGLAARLGTEARATEVLLDALAALGFVRKRDGRYANAPISEKLLRRGSPAALRSNLRYQELLSPAWARLSDVIRRGAPAVALDRLLARDARFTTEYIHGMADISRRPALELARKIGLSGVRDALDIGGGPGVYAAALAALAPGLRVTLLDLPPVLRIAKRRLARSGARRRVRFLPGDYRSADLGEGAYDLVLMSHITHDEGEDVNRRLLERAFAALRPGGRVAIHDFMLEPDRTGPRYGALFAVHMLVYTRRGRTYTVDEYRRWMREAGFAGLRTFDIAGRDLNATRAVVGRKR